MGSWSLRQPDCRCSRYAQSLSTVYTENTEICPRFSVSYLCKVTGLSRAQITRLITQFRERGHIADRRGPPAKPLAQRYLQADVHLLAEVDTLHATLSGPATRKFCERTYRISGDARYERLVAVSNRG